MKISTLAIGDELLTGKISDTNSTFVAEKLFDQGLRLHTQKVIADEEQEIISTIENLATTEDHVICFGGLGPTSDDKTTECCAKLLKCELLSDPPSLERLKGRYNKLGRTLTEASLKQVLYPKESKIIENLEGMAPGFYFQIKNCTFYFLPGVPSEMKPMVTQEVLPKILSKLNMKPMESKIWKCIGIAESDLQTRMTPIERLLPKQVSLGYRTLFPENHLSIYYPTTLKEEVSVFVDEINSKVKDVCFSTAALETLEEHIVKKLLQTKKTIVLVESCTGGLATHRLTQIPDASKCVWGGYSVYTEAAKDKMLSVKVSPSLKAVSEPCTEALAVSALSVSGADIAAAITGFMGPKESELPMGTLYFCILTKDRKKTAGTLLVRGRTRPQNQHGASSFLLREIQKILY